MASSYGPSIDEILFRYQPGREAPTFTRSSEGRYRDAGLVQQTAASDILRDQHYVRNENGILVRATRLEAARTNSILQSEALDHADWSKGGASVNANQENGPDGNLRLDEIVEGSTDTLHRVEQALTLTADANYAISAWAIANTRNWLLLEMAEQGNTANRVTGWFDLSSGVTGSNNSNGTGGFVRMYVEDYTDAVSGLYRCVLVGSVGNAATSIIGRIAPTTGDSTRTYAGDGSSSLYAGYAQLEDTSEFASSYIATTSSAVSRSADSLEIPTGFDPQECTAYGKVSLSTIDTLASLMHVGNETDGFRVEIDASNNLVGKIFNGGSTGSSSVSIGHSVQDIAEYRVVWDTDGDVTAHVSLNGGSESSGSEDTSQSLPSSFGTNDIEVGAEQDATNPAVADHISGPIIAPGVKTMAEMRSLAGTG